MKINKQDLKKLIIQEMLQEQINNEGALDWAKKQAQKGLIGISNIANKGAAALETPELDKKKLDSIANFLQQAQRDTELSKLILTTTLGRKIFGDNKNIQQQNLNEILTGDFEKMMRDKKVTNADMEDFINAMSKNAKANKILSGLLGKQILNPNQSSNTTSVSQEPSQQAQVPAQPVATAPKDSKQATQQQKSQINTSVTSDGPELNKQVLDRAFLRNLITRLAKFKRANKKNKRVILNQIIKDLKNMAETEGEKDLEIASTLVSEIIAEELTNVLTGKNK